MSLMVEMTLRAIEDRFQRAARACPLCAFSVPHAPAFRQHAVQDRDGAVTLILCAAYAIWSAP